MYRVMVNDCAAKVFNIGSGTGHSLNELISIIKDVTNESVSVKYEQKRSFDVPKIYLNIERAKTALAWEPKTKLEDGIRDVWNFVKQVIC